MPFAPILIALSLALSAGERGAEVVAGGASFPQEVVRLATQRTSLLLGEAFDFERKGRRNPFERPSDAPPEIGKRLTYHQQLQLVRQARGLLDEIAAAHGRGERGVALARYDQLLNYPKYRVGIEEIRKQLMDAIQSAQVIVAEATTAQAAELLAQIKAFVGAGQADRALECYQQVVTLTSIERFTDPALRNRMEELRRQANQSARGLAVAWARGLCDTMQERMDRGEFGKVIAAADDAASMLKEEDLAEDGERAEARSLLLRTVRLRREAELQNRFNGEGIVVCGVVYTPSLPSAIVNGRIVYEGDQVNGIKVTRIEPQKVLFLYQGQSVARTLTSIAARPTEPEQNTSTQTASNEGE